MGALFDRYARLREGLIYDRDAYDRRPGVDPELISHGLEPITDLERDGMAEISEIDGELLFQLCRDRPSCNIRASFFILLFSRHGWTQ